MANDIIITPVSASIQFSGSANASIKLTVDASGSLSITGNSGSLFSITDNLSGSLMSVNTIAGLPILEVFSDNRVNIGKYAAEAIRITGSNATDVALGSGSVMFISGSGRVGIGINTPVNKLDVAGNISASVITASLFSGSLSGSHFGTSSWATNALTAALATSINFTASNATTAQTASYLTIANSYQMASLTSSNISSSGVSVFNKTGFGTSSALGNASPMIDVSYGDYQNAGCIRLGADLGVNNSRTTNARKFGMISSFPYNNTSQSIFVIGADAQSTTVNAVNIGGGSGNMASPTRILFFTTSSIQESGTERMRIDGSGNVGIGTSTGANPLSVNGASSFGTYAATTAPANGIIVSGNVGIGTTNPAAKLSVAGTISATDTITATDTLYIQKGVGGYLSYITAEQTVASTGNSFKFWNSGAGTLMTIGYNGNVGIGTTLPVNKLDVAGNISASVITASLFSGSLSGSHFGTSSYASASISSSYALSASYAPGGSGLTGGTTNYIPLWTSATTQGISVISQSANLISVSGSLFVSQSITASSISASVLSASNAFVSNALVIGDNIITLNAAPSPLRYAGFEAYDSGSGTLTSLLWDSLNNYFFASGSEIGASRQFILGPSGEANLIANYIPLISGSNNLSSSVMYQSGGYIGVGLTNPVNKFDVLGNISCSVITASLFNGFNFLGGITTISSSTTTTVDLQYAVTQMQLSQSITTFAHSNAKTGTVTWMLATVGAGTSVTITWPTSYKWPGGVAPSLTTTTGKRDVYQFMSYDGASTSAGYVFATVVAQNM
jgi:hypothetical protein